MFLVIEINMNVKSDTIIPVKSENNLGIKKTNQLTITIHKKILLKPNIIFNFH
jgi:hypothetical protein